MLKTKIVKSASLIALIFQLASSGIIYPMTTVVDKCDTQTDKIFFRDTNGNRWCEKEIEDWCEGDLAALLMFNNFTEDISDDIILGARYNGSLSDFQKGE